jgi:hypothetical protein
LLDRTSPASPAIRAVRATAAFVVASGAIVGSAVLPGSTSSAAISPTPTQLTGLSAGATTPAKSGPRFPGHRPGRIYLGMSCGEQCHQRIPQLGHSFGVHRWFKKWGNWHGVAEAIKEDRRNDRRPWISIEGPDHGAPTGWRAVGRGHYDHAIRQLARTLKANDSEPVFISFDHEPSNKGPSYAGAWWAHGFDRFHDVLRRAHALRHVALAPIMAGWMFSKYNHGDRPADWLRPGVLRRADFLGVDIYENDKGLPFGRRLPRIARWLGKHGHPRMMLGIGESGATDMYKAAMPAAVWLNRSLRWAAHHPSRVAVVSYFNSTAYSRTGAYWPLDETARKMRVYKRWLTSAPFISRVR